MKEKEKEKEKEHSIKENKIKGDVEIKQNNPPVKMDLIGFGSFDIPL